MEPTSNSWSWKPRNFSICTFLISMILQYLSLLGPLLKPNSCWRRRGLQYFLHCYWCISPILRHQYITNRYTYHFLKFVLREYAMSNIISKLSKIPDFQSRWLRGGKNIGFISYYMLPAERMTYSCTTIRLRLYDYIGYGCTTLELWLYNYKGLSCTTAEFWFFDGIHELR